LAEHDAFTEALLPNRLDAADELHRLGDIGEHGKTAFGGHSSLIEGPCDMHADATVGGDQSVHVIRGVADRGSAPKVPADWRQTHLSRRKYYRLWELDACNEVVAGGHGLHDPEAERNAGYRRYPRSCVIKA
jgi:hypothetical protein